MVVAADKGRSAVGAGNVVRPGEALLPGDKGFGCRFVLGGGPKGRAETVEVRLLRPGLVDGRQAQDRWFVPARRGMTAVAAYAFDTPETVKPGNWTLELYLADALLAQKRFVMVAGQPAAATPFADPPAPEPVAVPAQPFVSDPPGSPAGSVSSPEAQVVVPPAAPAKAAAAVSPSPSPVPVPAAPAVTAGPRSSASPPAMPSKRPTPFAAPKRPAGQAGTVAASAGKPAGGPPSGGNAFLTLQVGVFSSSDNAEALAVRLRAKGLPACLSVEGAGSGRRYRVLAGRFGDRRAAMANRAEIASRAAVKPVLFTVTPERAAGLRCH